MGVYFIRRRWWFATLPLLAALAGCAAGESAAAPDEDHSSDDEAHVAVRAEPARIGTLTLTVEGLGAVKPCPITSPP